MKIALYCYCTTSNRIESSRGFEIIKEFGVRVDKDERDKDPHEYLYLREKEEWYEFVRADENFIKAIEHIFETNPWKHCPGNNYEGCIFIEKIDDRFADKKYWEIEKDKRGNERLRIHTDLIIDDLYNSR
jgi:hypothetical protein